MSLLDILEANKALLEKIENYSISAMESGERGAYSYSDQFDELYKDLRDIQFALHKHIAEMTNNA